VFHLIPVIPTKRIEYIQQVEDMFFFLFSLKESQWRRLCVIYFFCKSEKIMCYDLFKNHAFTHTLFSFLYFWKMNRLLKRQQQDCPVCFNCHAPTDTCVNGGLCDASGACDCPTGWGKFEKVIDRVNTKLKTFFFLKKRRIGLRWTKVRITLFGQ
jgi:hypothetical protein